MLTSPTANEPLDDDGYLDYLHDHAAEIRKGADSGDDVCRMISMSFHDYYHDIDKAANLIVLKDNLDIYRVRETANNGNTTGL